MSSDQKTRVPVTPGALETLRLPADVHLSPDGQRVAYVVLEPISDQPKRQGRIWVVDTSGGEPQPLTKGPAEDSCPRWSPDNQQLALISKSKEEGSKAQLFLMPTNSDEARQICTTPNGVSNLEWSPDGKHVAFLSLEGEEPKSDPRVITPNRHQRLWAITQTTRFKAAIMVAGVSYFHSFHAQSRLMDWDMRFLGGSPLEHPELYRERSAITYAARVKTPTLIIHGENDQDVPVNQSYAFYRALRERNVPVEFVIYPRESHSFIEHEHRKDCEERILSWFERYL